MASSNWDFTKLPESKHEYAIECFEKGDIPRMLRLHDTYKLSKNNYCCGGTAKAMLNWFGWAIKEGKISK